jgi:NAD(P)-dependent dehydrogenase (short-subunit alcohol dehydrogenase family)
MGAAALAREVAPHGITVNNQLPGLFETGRMRAYLAGNTGASPVAAIPTG